MDRRSPHARRHTRYLGQADSYTTSLRSNLDPNLIENRHEECFFCNIVVAAVLNKDGKDLLLANLLLQPRGLVEKAKGKVKDSLDRKAWSIVDKYMWGAGGVAAINPFPVVDLLAGSAISTKMIIDLAEVYQQKVDLETASRWLGEMGKNLIGSPEVELESSRREVIDCFVRFFRHSYSAVMCF